MLLFFKVIFLSQYYLFADLCYRLWSRTPSDFYSVEKKLVQLLKIKTQVLSKQTLSPETKIVLANHRSFTDFFLDAYLCQGAAGLSRWILAFVLPAVGLYGLVLNRVVFFHRGKTKRDILNKKILSYFDRSSRPLIVYPEGKRYTGLEPIALKHGLLKSCFDYNWPCQLLIVSNKENIIAEKKFFAQKNILCLYEFSETILPHDFEKYEDFYNHVDSTWKNLWNKVLCEATF